MVLLCTSSYTAVTFFFLQLLHFQGEGGVGGDNGRLGGGGGRAAGGSHREEMGGDNGRWVGAGRRLCKGNS